ncbi:MAG: hypothetical protein MUF75_04540 [Bacteroidia bacterium]|jgi:hypothetical protein|nr:hypothetical protein [Bacteroidia bacterium]
MIKPMFSGLKHLFTLVFFLASSAPFLAQDPPSIKVRKSSNLAKVVLDNTTYKLVVMDRFGNPTEARILNYRLHIKLKRETKVFEGNSNFLTREMVNFLNGLNSATKIFFTELKAEEKEGHLTDLPDLIDTWFPDCSNCDKKRNRK